MKIARIEEPKATYSIEELTAELGIGRAAVYAGLREGTIPAIRLGRRFIVPRAAVAEWLKSAAGTVTAA